MSKLGEKYIAGFLDADGCIMIQWKPLDRKDSDPTRKRASVTLKFSQMTVQDEVLDRIQEAIGGGKYTRKDGASSLEVTGKAAHMVLSRIQKHLVIKRHIAGIALEMHGKVFDKEEGLKLFRQHRKIKSLPLPNYPSRQWLAGYFDGDGCFSTRLPKTRRNAQFTAEIVASDYDAEGVELIQKAFGGSICVHGQEGHLRAYTLTMPPSKAKEFLSHFAKHLITKRDQAYFILGCAEMGHYRDGSSIKSAMKQLKAHPHRLNEPKSDVTALLSTVRDIPLADTYVGRNYWPEGRSKAHLTKR